MIISSFIQANQRIVHRSVKEENFESLIHHFNSNRTADEGKLRFKDKLIFFLTQTGKLNSLTDLSTCGLILAIVTSDDLIYEMEIPRVLRNMIESIDFDPFVQIEDTVLLLDSVISNLGVSNFKPDTLQAIRQMDSYDEKVHNISRANKEMESKMKREPIEGVNKLGVKPQMKEMPQMVSPSVQMPQPVVNKPIVKKDTSAEVFKRVCETFKPKGKNLNKNVQFTVREKVKAVLNKEGKVIKNEINGELLMFMSNSDLKECKIQIKTNFECKFSPNLDRDDAKKSILRAKNAFPVEKQVPLARWQRKADFDDLTFSIWETEQKESSPTRKPGTDIIMDYEKSYDIPKILFLFNSTGKNITGNCKNRSDYLVWQSEKESENIEFTSNDTIYPIKVFYTSSRKCQFDILSVETNKNADEKFDTDYVYEVESVEIVE